MLAHHLSAIKDAIADAGLGQDDAQFFKNFLHALPRDVVLLWYIALKVK